jgi:hypothetical protein
MVYICMLEAGELSQPMHPFAAITIKGLYEEAACIIRGNNEHYCPDSGLEETSKSKSCWGGHCTAHTRFCASMRVATFREQTTRDPSTNALQVEMVPSWERKRAPHSCCHYPETEAVWESRWAHIQLLDEDTLNRNDVLASFDLDLQNKAVGEFEFVLPEQDSDGAQVTNNITIRVATFWHRPMEYEVSHEFDADPRRWSSVGLSVTASDPPWETHREFDGRFGNLHVELITDTEEQVLDKEAHLRMDPDPELTDKIISIHEADAERERLEKEWEASLKLRADTNARVERSGSTFARTATIFGIGAAALALVAYRRHVRVNGHYARSLLGHGAVSSSEQVPGASL